MLHRYELACSSVVHSEVMKLTQETQKVECSQQPFVEPFQAEVLKTYSF